MNKVGVRGTSPAPISFISCSFRKNFGQIIGWRPPVWETLDPPLPKEYQTTRNCVTLSI